MLLDEFFNHIKIYRRWRRGKWQHICHWGIPGMPSCWVRGETIISPGEVVLEVEDYE